MRKLFLSLGLLLFLLLSTFTASANVLPYQRSGTMGNEVFLAKSSPVLVEGEELSFCLASQTETYTLQSNVTAIYSLYNPAEQVETLQLFFPVILQNDLEAVPGTEIFFNGDPLSFQETTFHLWDQKEELFGSYPFLKEWQEELSEYSVIRLLNFTLSLAPGERAQLAISTETEAFMERDTIFRYFTLETRYTFCYLLSPARYWNDFNALTVTVELSPAAPILLDSSLPLTRTGVRTYRFESNSLPEKELVFTVASPFRRRVFVCCIAVIAAVVFCWLRRNRKKKRGHS